jgi:hypothetical protein
VVYVDYDSTHLTNVNKALLDNGHAVISNFNNEFSPYSWSLLVEKYESPEETDFSPYPLTPTPITPPYLSKEAAQVIVGLAFILIIVVLAILENRIKKRRRYK